MADTTVVLTGATSGIGLATARLLAARDVHLVLHGPQPADDVDLPRAMTYVPADYGDLASVVALAAAIRERTDGVDVLVNNAGRPGPARRTLTADGHEATWQVNYLAPVLLTAHLPARRVVNVASATHFSATLALDDPDLEHAYGPSAAYARSKLALVTWTGWLARHLPRGTAEVVSLHPGVIATDLLHAMFSVTGASPESAAVNVVAAVDASGDNGTYYDERTPAPPAAEASDPGIQDALHALTDRQLVPYL